MVQIQKYSKNTWKPKGFAGYQKVLMHGSLVLLSVKVQTINLEYQEKLLTWVIKLRIKCIIYMGLYTPDIFQQSLTSFCERLFEFYLPIMPCSAVHVLLLKHPPACLVFKYAIALYQCLLQPSQDIGFRQTGVNVFWSTFVLKYAFSPPHTNKTLWANKLEFD